MPSSSRQRRLNSSVADATRNGFVTDRGLKTTAKIKAPLRGENISALLYYHDQKSISPFLAYLKSLKKNKQSNDDKDLLNLNGR
jgi:hypothetical protein